MTHEDVHYQPEAPSGDGDQEQRVEGQAGHERQELRARQQEQLAKARADGKMLEAAQKVVELRCREVEAEWRYGIGGDED
jgi:hypothetical protein